VGLQFLGENITALKNLFDSSELRMENFQAETVIGHRVFWEICTDQFVHPGIRSEPREMKG